MRDFTELVKALRVCGSAPYDCSDCPIESDECNGVMSLFSRAADAIEELLAERDRYKSFFDRITDLPDCNICLKKNRCEFAPRPGEHTRINCPLALTEPPKGVE